MSISPKLNAKLKINAWERSEHLFRVYQIIFESEEESFDSEQYSDALNWARSQLFVWKARNGNYSDAIEWEATYAIVTAIIEDRNLLFSEKTEHKLLAQTNVCSLYSIAIVKFHNILPYYQMNENGHIIRNEWQNSGSLKAANFGLPEWFVECRHKICHSSTPSLILLRQAANVALQWLRVNYWQSLIAEQLESNSVDDSDFICAFDLLLFGSKSERKQIERIIAKALKRNSILTLSNASQYIIKNSSELQDVEIEETTCFVLPPTLEAKFSPLMSLLSSQNLVIPFLQQLVLHFGAQDEIDKAAIFWFAVIVSALDPDSKSTLSEMLKPKKDNLHKGTQRILWVKLFYALIKHANKYTHLLVPLFTKHVSSFLSSTKCSILQNLCKIYFQNSIKSSINETSLKTIEDVKVALNEDLSKQQTIDWCSLNLGTRPSDYSTNSFEVITSNTDASYEDGNNE